MLEDRAGLDRGEFEALAAAVASHGSIKRAVDWMVRHDAPLAPAGMVTQDEFSHDILVPLPSGLWLVYDST